MINPDSKIGYFSSNNQKEKEVMIYINSMRKKHCEETEKLFVGKVVDALFGTPIENV